MDESKPTFASISRETNASGRIESTGEPCHGFAGWTARAGEAEAVTFHFFRRALLVGAPTVFGFCVASLGPACDFAAASAFPPANFGVSQPGNYLAGLIASADHDAAAAAAYYNEALRNDPRNPDLIERAFSATLSNGDVQDASGLAERLLLHDPNDRLARLAVSANLLERGEYAAARAQLLYKDAQWRDVTATLLAAWCYAGQGDVRRALDTLDRIHDAAIYAFRDFHAGLIANQLGNVAEARRRLKSAFDADKNALRFADAYARFLAEHGDHDGALTVYESFASVAPHNPIVERAISDLRSDRLPPISVRSPKDGAAEVLYGLGAAGIRQGDELPALVYLRLSLYLRPDDDLTSVTLANLFEQMRKDELAISAYESVPVTSPLHKDAQIQASLVLDGMGQSADSIKRLNAIVAARPHDVDALSALAGVQRSGKMYQEAASNYTKAISAVGIPNRDNWTLFYFRGICFERAKQWSKAEDDFRKALELFPDQPLVLNYLGYSWVDQGVNLEEALKMLHRAVELRPNDGYIIDSLGWAHFKLGQYLEAAQTLERAVDLKPADPVLNDHLGDAYWRVNRRTEAKFQWNHARDMKPEPEDLPQIIRKIEVGLPDQNSGGPDHDNATTSAGGG